MNEGCEGNLEMGGTVTALAINFDLEESTRSPWRVRLGYRGEKEIYPRSKNITYTPRCLYCTKVMPRRPQEVESAKTGLLAYIM